MRKSMTIAIFSLLVVLLVCTFAVRPEPAYALQAGINKIKGDYASVEVSITLIWEDADDDANRDWFRLKIYEVSDSASSSPIAQFDEKISPAQSPYYWNTHRISAIAPSGRYAVEIWDLDGEGTELGMIDQAVHDSFANLSWRGGTIEGPAGTHPYPTLAPDYIMYPGCHMYMPVYTTNMAPEAGSVIVVWTGNPEHADGGREEHVWYTFEVNQNDYFTGTEHDGHLIPVPCGSWIRLYFQPSSTLALYLMPSQYWPDEYGTGMENNQTMMSYHTVFPLDGPTRTDGFAQPTSTASPPTATPIPTEDTTEDGGDTTGDDTGDNSANDPADA